MVIVSAVLSVSAKFVNSYVPLIVGRFIAGLVCGCFTGLGPTYLSEIAPKTLRGAAGTLHQLAIVVGITSTNILGLPQILGNLLNTDKLIFLHFVWNSNHGKFT